MKSRWIPCGPFINESERLATERLVAKLRGQTQSWMLLSNLRHSASTHRLSDEIDLLALLATGVLVIEIKHWDKDYLRQQAWVVENEAERINDKAKRIKGKLAALDPGFVAPRLLLTRGEVRYHPKNRPKIHGVPVFGLGEWSELFGLDQSVKLNTTQIEQIAHRLEPKTKLVLADTELRRFAQFTDLQRLAEDEGPFHRCYRGTHPTRRDKVILHLYDLSASTEPEPLNQAQREFAVIQHWQKSPYVPSLLDSFQEAEGYPGELYYFSLVDAGAVTLAKRAEDSSWSFAERLTFALETLRALQAFHEPAEHEPRLTHRNIHPWSLRVRHNNRPLFTDFRLGRLEGAATISPRQIDFGERAPFVAPEVITTGLAAATRQSDVYSVCRTLATLFAEDSPDSRAVLDWLEQGRCEDLGARAHLASLILGLEALQTPASPPAEIMDDDEDPQTLTPRQVEYWDEDTEVPFLDSTYKVLTRLGRGGIGQAFKVVEIDPEKNEKFGTYVAKAVSHQADGQATIRAYKHARSHSTHPHLSAIHAIAADWQPDRFVALLRWVDGQPLDELFGVLSLYAEEWETEVSETTDDARAECWAKIWLEQLCDALNAFHQVRLVHGDISPRNILVQKDQVGAAFE
ncbi:NERD domain-containing protein kinase family protein [Rhabdochromatium marinum]|uniref:NERD domain-containing protein kinase family protein n=1 Tax=Rhabdochromatium marinum TaxID=48729 RepID=UPI001904AB77|nr:NERD domain-containing protein kinase family protein [Rhabdochromatium marinum]MBK1649743.1 hypothetical protein [Rhabdochromatium marinum]